VLLVCAGAGLLLLLFGWAVWRSRRDVRASRAQVARWAQLTESLNDAADVTEVREALIGALTAEHPEGVTLVGLTAADPGGELSVVVRRGARSPLGNLDEDAAVTIAERVADADAAFAVERSPAVEAGLGGETLRTGSLYGVPLRYRDGRPAGSASVAFGRTQALGDHELSLLRAYAHQAEQALGRVRRH
jgi:GAF domain-containing protein